MCSKEVTILCVGVIVVVFSKKILLSADQKEIKISLAPPRWPSVPFKTK